MKKVLVVDDQVNIRKLIRFTLQKHFIVNEAEEGDAAIVAIQQDRPDIILLDVMMPGAYDGFQVLEWIKSNSDYRDIYVMMITARTQPSDQEQAMQAGADAYLPKPFSPTELLAFLNKL